MLAIPKPIVQLPVRNLAIRIVSVVAMVLHVRVFVRLRFLPACPVPSICSVTMCSVMLSLCALRCDKQDNPSYGK